MTMQTAAGASRPPRRPNARRPRSSGEKVGVFYGAKQALFDVDLEIEREPRDLADRAVGLRQVDRSSARSTA